MMSTSSLTGIFAGIAILPLVGLAVVFAFFAEARHVRRAGRFVAMAGLLLVLVAGLLFAVAGSLVDRGALVVALEVGAVITIAGFCSVVVARLRGA